MEPTNDAPEVIETPVEEAPVPEADAPEEVEADVRDAKIAELEDKNKKLFARAKAAEEAKKAIPQATVSEAQYSPKDYLALMSAGVTAEDFEEVERVAKILGKPIAETLADKTMKSILSERQEERKTASVAHTRGGARGTSKVSGEDLLAKAERTGEVPDDTKGMNDLFMARMARKLK